MATSKTTGPPKFKTLPNTCTNFTNRVVHALFYINANLLFSRLPCTTVGTAEFAMFELKSLSWTYNKREDFRKFLSSYDFNDSVTRHVTDRKSLLNIPLEREYTFGNSLGRSNICFWFYLRVWRTEVSLIAEIESAPSVLTPLAAFTFIAGVIFEAGDKYVPISANDCTISTKIEQFNLHFTLK